MTEGEKLGEIYGMYRDWLSGKDSQTLWDSFLAGYKKGFQDGLQKPVENPEE